MFPLVDETYFTKIHEAYRSREELMDKTDFMVYYAIIVAGFAVSSRLLVKCLVADGANTAFDRSSSFKHPVQISDRWPRSARGSVEGKISIVFTLKLALMILGTLLVPTNQ
jgi:hypothetical protein